MRLVNLHGESAHTALYCKDYTSYLMSLTQVYCVCVNLIVMSYTEKHTLPIHFLWEMKVMFDIV